MNLPENLKLIHEQAQLATKNYKKSESDLLDVIIQVREHKIFRYFDCASVFEYCVKILKLDAGVVYGFTAVAKKIKEVPELKEKISDGSLNVSTAKRITSVINSENHAEWFEKARTLTVRKLEKEVARVNPKAETPERASYLNSRRVKLELGLEEKLMLKLRWVQDLESQRLRRSVTLEEVFSVLTENYLKRMDPLEKAKRAKIRGRSRQKVNDFANSGGNAELAKSELNTDIASSELNTKASAIARESLAFGQSLAADENTFTYVTNATHPGAAQTTDPGVTKTTPPGVKSSTCKNQLQKSHYRSKRQAIPAQKIHLINLRDDRRCRFVNFHTGEKCQSRRFLEIHHRTPVHLGGNNALDNLITLCSEHHKVVHEHEHGHGHERGPGHEPSHGHERGPGHENKHEHKGESQRKTRI